MLDKTKTKTASKTEMIPYSNSTAITTGRVIITVDGIKPLLTHNPQSMGQTKGPGKGSRIPEPEIEAEAGTYRMEDGSCAIKGEAFRMSALGVSGDWKTKGRKTMKGQLAHIVVVEELVQLKRRDGTPIKDYVIHKERVRIQRQGVIRSRPLFDDWSCTFTVEFDPQLVADAKLIVDVCADAGNRLGVGDWRPKFGRFVVREYSIQL